MRRQAASAMLGTLREQEGRLLLDAARAHASIWQDARRDYRDLVSLALTQYREPANDWGAK